MTMPQLDLDGHRFQPQPVLDLDDQHDPYDSYPGLLVATCSCGWTGAEPKIPRAARRRAASDGVPAAEKAAFASVPPAERAAEAEWRTGHAAALATTVPPAALADAVHTVAEQLEALIEDDKPMAALAAVRLAGGGFPDQTRTAAQRASYLDYSWAQIGEALGLSKQAAWERYGKDQPPQPQEDPAELSPQEEALLRAALAESGDWDTRRAVAALGAAGHQVTDKRAREILRRLQRAGLLFRGNPARAVYTLRASARTAGGER
ncbi:hypothetical protein ABT263_25240 [Kitasatospora sp. NPDC001603]|uniref:hypothetical protein n=1 Tax=Kitasatospora sp. NPDC001603 TaxID=3154388 RepID=UPI00331CEE24